MEKKDESVLVIRSDAVRGKVPASGFVPNAQGVLDKLLDPERTCFRARSEMETNPDYKQLIPYVVLRHFDEEAGESTLFCYRRGVSQGEERLHGSLSVGIGGHISEEDAEGGDDPYETGMLRELEEEVRIDCDVETECYGMVNDDTTEVGKVHLGVVHVANLSAPTVSPAEGGIEDAQFVKLSELINRTDEMETWSKHVVEYLHRLEIEKRKTYGVAFNVQAGGQMYAPARDFAYNYPRMIKMVIDSFSADYWPELFRNYVTSRAVELLHSSGENQEESADEAFNDLEAAKDAYCRFLNLAASSVVTTCDEALTLSGWLDCLTTAQSTWLAMLGQVMTGQLFHGIRDLQRDPDEPPAEIEELLATGESVRRRMNKLNSGEDATRMAARSLRNAVRDARVAGFSFEQIEELVADVKYGRVAAGE